MLIANREQGTESPKIIQRVWVVVKVVAGLPCYVEAYDSVEKAETRATELAREIDLGEDDIGYYETIINSSEEDTVNLYEVS